MLHAKKIQPHVYRVSYNDQHFIIDGTDLIEQLKSGWKIYHCDKDGNRIELMQASASKKDCMKTLSDRFGIKNTHDPQPPSEPEFVKNDAQTAAA